MPLTINAVSFKMPNGITRVKTRNVMSQRSVNGRLNTDIFSFAKKNEFVMDFSILTSAQLTTLEQWIDTGAFTVIITDTDYAYNASSILSYSGHTESFAGYKTGVKVKVTEI